MNDHASTIVIEDEIAATLDATELQVKLAALDKSNALARHESALFGAYVAAVHRALLAADHPTARNTSRAMIALQDVDERLTRSTSTNRHRAERASLTLDVLKHFVTDAAADRAAL